MWERTENGRVVLTMTLLGAPRLFHGPTPLRVANRKLLALLGVLALSETGTESRERMVGLLWSESDEALARGSLRQAMSAFRKLVEPIGFEGLTADREALVLAPGAIRTDVAAIEAATGGGRAHPALVEAADVPGRLMLTCDELDPALRFWLADRRRAWRERLLRRLSADLAAAATGAAEEEDLATAILRLDPTQEPAARRLMAARARAGDPAGAVRVYDALWRALEEEHDLEPSEETAALAVWIKSGGGADEALAPASGPEATGAVGAAGRPAAEAAAAAEETERAGPVILVERFRLNGGDAAGAELLEGFRHALLASLARFREWRVADAAEGNGPVEAGGARYRLRADAQGAGLATALTLVEAGSGVIVWSDRFALDRSGWAAAQGRLLRQAVTALNLHLAGDRSARGVEATERGPTLHDLWLRAQTGLRAFRPEGWREAEGAIAEALRRAPDWAPGWSARALLLTTAHMAAPGLPREAAREVEALSAARRGAALDPLDARGRLALGWALAFRGDWDGACAALAEAERLNDNDDWLLISAAAGRAAAGEGEAAARLVASAVEAGRMDRPRWAFVAGARWLAGDDSGALEAGLLAADGMAHAGLWRALALVGLGQAGAARAEMRGLLDRLAEGWAGPAPAEDGAAAGWLLNLLPLRRADDRARLRDAMAAAGAPEGALIFADEA